MAAGAALLLTLGAVVLFLLRDGVKPEPHDRNGATAAPQPPDEQVRLGIWSLGLVEGNLPGLVPRPAALAGLGRWQVETVAPRGRIYTLNWSPDGKLIACGGTDGCVRVYDVDAGCLTHVLLGHPDGVFSVARSEDGQRLASAGEDSTVRVWTRDGKLLRVLGKHHLWATSVAWGRGVNSRHLASGGYDHTVRLWETDREAPAMVLGKHGEPVKQVAWSPDGNLADNARLSEAAECLTEDAGHQDYDNELDKDRQEQVFQDCLCLWECSLLTAPHSCESALHIPDRDVAASGRHHPRAAGRR